MCSHCWSHGTYHLPYESDIPPDDKPYTDDDDQQQQQPRARLSYYQYVPLILLFQALGFYVPYLLWTRLSSGSGLDLPSLLDCARGADSATDMADIQSQKLLYMTRQIDRSISYGVIGIVVDFLMET